MNNEKIEEILKKLGAEELPADVLEIAEHKSRDFEKTLTQSKQPKHIKLTEYIMKTNLRKIFAAAAVIIFIVLVVGLYLFIGPVKITTVAFADVARPILTARTATCKITIDADQDKPSQTIDCLFAEPGRMRQEKPGEYISIVDMQQGKIVILMLEEKKAIVMEVGNMSDEHKEGSQADIFIEVRKQIQQAQQDENASVEYLGEQKIGGQTAIGYHIEEAFFETTIWADAKSFLPIRIETSMPTVMDRRITAVFTDFAFNVKLDDSLFSLKIPEGYDVETMQWEVSAPQEEDLIEMLDLWAENSGGKFPSALNMNAMFEFSKIWLKESNLELEKERERSRQLSEKLNKLLERLNKIRLSRKQLRQEYEKSSGTEEKRRILKQWQEENEKISKEEGELKQQLEQVTQQMKDESEKRLRQAEDLLKKGSSGHLQEAQNRMMPIMRGIMFVQKLPADSDWHYVGKNVKFGESEKSVFWYKPEGSADYRVIYGDLTVKDVALENLPE